jgi:small-conductance mechanosensitive channel
MKLSELKKEVFSNIKKSVYKRIFFLLVLFGMIQLLLHFNNIGLVTISSSILKFFDITLFSILTIIFVNIILRLTVAKLFHYHEQETEIEQRIFITKIYTYFLYFFAISIILWKIGVSITNIALVIGIAATGVAFAVREVILAFFVWLVILTKHPFRINDVIKIGDDVGQVNRIGTFYVTIKISS